VAGDATTRNKLDPIETKALRPQKKPQAVYTLGAFLSELLPQFLGFWLGDGGVGKMCRRPLRSKSGSLAKFAAMRRASPHVSRLVADRRPGSFFKINVCPALLGRAG
jgi:hypothetical protein